MNTFIGNSPTERDEIDSYPRRNTRPSLTPTIIVNRQGTVLDDEGFRFEEIKEVSSSDNNKTEKPVDESKSKVISVNNNSNPSQDRQTSHRQESANSNNSQTVELAVGDVCVEVSVEQNQEEQLDVHSDSQGDDNGHCQQDQDSKDKYSDHRKHNIDTQSDQDDQSNQDSYHAQSDRNKQDSKTGLEGDDRASVTSTESRSTITLASGNQTTESDQHYSQSVDLNTSENDEDDVDYNELGRTSLRNQNDQVLVSEL